MTPILYSPHLILKPPVDTHASTEQLTRKRKIKTKEGLEYQVDSLNTPSKKYHRDPSSSFKTMESRSSRFERHHSHSHGSRHNSSHRHRSHHHSSHRYSSHRYSSHRSKGELSRSDIRELPKHQQIEAIQYKYDRLLRRIYDFRQYDYAVSMIQKAINSDYPITFASEARTEDIMQAREYTAWIANAPVPWCILPSTINFPDVIKDHKHPGEILLSATACVNRASQPRLVVLILIELQRLGIQVDPPLCTAVLTTYKDAVEDDEYWLHEGWGVFQYISDLDIGTCISMFKLLKTGAEKRMDITQYWKQTVCLSHQVLNCEQFIEVFPSITQSASAIYTSKPDILLWLIDFWEGTLTSDYKVHYSATSLMRLFTSYIDSLKYWRDRESLTQELEYAFSPQAAKTTSHIYRQYGYDCAQAAAIIAKFDKMNDALFDSLSFHPFIKTSFAYYVAALTYLYPNAINKIPDRFCTNASGELDDSVLPAYTVALGGAAATDPKYLAPLFENIEKLKELNTGISLSSALKALSRLGLDSEDYFDKFLLILNNLHTPSIAGFFVGLKEVVQKGRFELSLKILKQSIDARALLQSPAFKSTNQNKTCLFLDFKGRNVISAYETRSGEIKDQWPDALALPPEVVFVIIYYWIKKTEQINSELNGITSIHFNARIKDISTYGETYLLRQLPILKRVERCYGGAKSFVVELNSLFCSVK